MDMQDAMMEENKRMRRCKRSPCQRIESNRAESTDGKRKSTTLPQPPGKESRRGLRKKDEKVHSKRRGEQGTDAIASEKIIQ